MAAELTDYLINGLSLNTGIQELVLDNFTFNENCAKSWSLCFAVNKTITSINSNSYVQCSFFWND